MSVIFIPPASAASVPDATETTAGKVRLATSAEATAGVNDVAAMTPAKVKAAIDASISGGVTYRGTFDAGSPADLSNAVQGDLYIISGAGTYAGRSWAVGDHLLVNADMGGTFDSAKIDKIDSTDAVTSVAGRTGAVTLSASDISGLATVATSGAYSDLSGTPSLATVATSGDYDDLSNLPTLGTAAALDVGTTALKVVQLDASAKLPAVDGSQLTNLPSAPVTSVAGRTGAVTLSASDISGLATVATSGAYADLSGTPSLATVATSGAYADLSGTPSLATVATSGDYDDLSNLPTLGTAAALDVGTTALKVVQLDASARLPAVDGSQLTNLPSAPVTSVAGRTGAITLSASDISGLATVATSGAYADLSGTPSLATVATSGAYADLSGTPSLATVATSGDYDDLSNLPTLGTAAALDVGTTALDVVQLDASGKLPAVDGSQLTNLPSAPVTSVAGRTGAVTLSASDISGLATVATSGAYADLSGTPTLATVATSGAYSDLSGLPTLGTAAALDVGTAALKVVQLDASGKLPAVDGSQLTNVVSSVAVNQITDVTITSVADRQVLTYDAGTSEWINSAVAYADITGTPALATVATSGAYADLSGTPSLATVATSGDYDDLSNLPTLGTAAALDVGTTALKVVQLDASAKLPAVDGSQLTNLPSAPVTSVAGRTGAVTLSASDISGLATVATSGAYSDLSGLPTLGTAAALDVGTTALKVVQLDASAKLPAVDGSQLTNVVAAPPTYESKSANFTASADYHYSVSATSSTITCTLPARSGLTVGKQIRFKLYDATHDLILSPNGSDTIDGLASYTLTNPKQSITLVNGDNDWEIL